MFCDHQLKLRFSYKMDFKLKGPFESYNNKKKINSSCSFYMKSFQKQIGSLAFIPNHQGKKIGAWFMVFGLMTPPE